MKTAFSYVVLRYMHDVFTREFVNIGVVVYCPQAGFLKMKGLKRLKRAKDFFPGLERGSLLKTLRFMESRFAAYDAKGQQSFVFEGMDAATMAKSILPADDSALQWSAPGGGTTENPAQVLEELFKRMVTRHEEEHPVVRRTDEEVWQPFEAALQARNRQILSSLQAKELSAGSFRHRFEHAWQPEQGPLHLLLPLSFDLVDSSGIVDKAVAWSGRVRLLRKAAPQFEAFLLIGKPSEKAHEPAYAEAIDLLESDRDSKRTIVPEDQADAFAEVFYRSVLSPN
jgi:hypothetical protein